MTNDPKEIAEETQPDRAPGQTPEELAAESLAQFFHETYERLAPEHGYETRKESAKPWADVPQQNKGLMIAVCDRVLSTSLLQALAGKDAEITRLQVNLEAAHSDSGKAYGQMVSAMTDLAAERAKREEAEEEREKYRIAATVLCGAHIGVPQAKCPGCERDANMQRAEQTEARLAELKAYDSKSTELYMAGVLEGQKTRDEQLAKANEQLKQAARAHTCVHHTDAEREKSGSCPVCANEQLRKVTEQMNAAVKSWRQGQEQLVAEAAKYSVLIAIFKSIRGGWVLQHEVAKLIDAAISSEPHAALQRYGLEVAERAWNECFAIFKGENCYIEYRQYLWLESQTRASLTGQTEVQP